MEQKLRQFLARYLDDPETTTKPKNRIVLQEPIDLLVSAAGIDHIEQEIIDYGTDHPDASFWDLLLLVKPGDFTQGEDEK